MVKQIVACSKIKGFSSECSTNLYSAMNFDENSRKEKDTKLKAQELIVSIRLRE